MSVEGRLGPAALFAGALYRSAPAASFVEIRYRLGDGMGHRFVEVERLDRLVGTVLSLASRTDVYVGVVPRRRHGGGRRDLVERAGVVWVDCDSSESVEALRGFRPLPGMAVGSGSGQNRHAYWFLDEPVELDVIERANRRLAGALDADLRCAEAARILRPVGSVNRKHSPPVAVRLLRLEEHDRVAIAELEQRLPADPSPVVTVHARRPRPPGAGEDRLELIPPREYFERLTGRPVGRSGKARCPFHDLSVGRAIRGADLPARPLADASLTDPLLLVPAPVYFERLTGLRVGRSGKLRCLFHDDRSPSLHVYREPGRGWYCFGCGRGGSIYDLAALLWLTGQSRSGPLRGRQFLEIRQRLMETFSGGSANA